MTENCLGTVSPETKETRETSEKREINGFEVVVFIIPGEEKMTKNNREILKDLFSDKIFKIEEFTTEKTVKMSRNSKNSFSDLRDNLYFIDVLQLSKEKYYDKHLIIVKDNSISHSSPEIISKKVKNVKS